MATELRRRFPRLTLVISPLAGDSQVAYLLPRDLPEPPPKKRRNEPSLLPWIGKRVASLRGQDVARVAGMTSENARALFR